MQRHARQRRPAAGDAGAILYLRSEGNPFFIAQFVAAIAEQGSIALEESLPRELGALIATRLERLSPDARAVALLAAVVGDAFDIELLQELTAWHQSRLVSALGELLDRRLVRDTGSTRNGDYAFAHHLIEGAAYAAAGERDLSPRHIRVAQALEELYPDRLDDLSHRIARHYERGNRGDSAALYYARA